MKMQANKNGFLRNFCVAALVSLLAQCVWAAAPVAVWEGDFKTTTKGNVSLDLQGNSVENDEYGSTIMIKNGATQGVKFSWTTGRDGYTIIAKVRTLKTNTSKRQVIVNGGANGNRTGVTWETDGTTKGIWNNTSWHNASYVQKQGKLSAVENSDTFHIAGRHKSSNNGLCGTYLFANTGSGWESVYEANGCRADGDKTAYTAVSLGGPITVNDSVFVAASGMIIEKVAIFHDHLTTDDLNAFRWPSEVVTYTGTVANGQVSWTPALPETPTANDYLEFVGSGDIAVPSNYASFGKITIGNGVNLIGADASELANGKFSGEGSVVVSSDCTLTVPADTKVKTRGNIAVTLTNDGTFEVESGTCTVTAPDNEKIAGTVIVCENATFVNAREKDAIKWSGSIAVHVYGTLDFGETRWTLGGNTKIYLYAGAEVTGDGEGANGALDFNGGNGNIYVKSNGSTTGKVTCSAPMRNRQGGTINVDQDMVFETTGNVIKYGDGVPTKVGSGVWSVKGGSYASGATVNAGTLKFVGVSPASTITMGNGTLELSQNEAKDAFTFTGTVASSSLGNGTIKTAGSTVTLSGTFTNYSGDIDSSAADSKFIIPVDQEVTVGLIADGSKIEIEGMLVHTNKATNAYTSYQGKNLSGLTGNGTFKITGPHYFYTCGTDNISKYWASTLALCNDRGDSTIADNKGIVFGQPKNGNATITIGSLSGAGLIRTDANDGDRTIKIVQAKNTEWSGAFNAGDRVKAVIVTGADGATEKTLTLSGTQTHTNDLSIEGSGSVMLTGTWKAGTVTVNGRLEVLDAATLEKTTLTSAGSLKTADSTVYFGSDELASAEAAAKAGTTYYATIADAIAAATLADITIINASAEVPAGYAKVTKDGVVTLRQIGGKVYYKDGAWSDGCTVWADAAHTATTTFNVADTMVLDTNDTVVYPNKDITSALKIEIAAGITAVIGHDNYLTANPYNVPNNSVITLGEGAHLGVTFWNNATDHTPAFGTVTINGGTFGVHNVTSKAINAGTIKGTSQLVLNEGETITISGSIETKPISGVVTKRVVATEVAGGIKYSLETIQPEPPTPTEGGITPSIPGADTIEIVDAEGETVTGGTIPLETGVYTVTGKVGDTVVATETLAVVKTKDAESGTAPDPVTTAVAVPFKGATVANLLNTALLNEGDELKAFVGGSYSAWTLAADKKTWTPVQKARDGADPEAGAPATAELKRGTAVWVTTAGKVVAFGTYDSTADVSEVTKGYNLIGNPMMQAIKPAADTVGDILIPVGSTDRYTVIEKEGEKVWQCSMTVSETIDGEVIDSEVISEAAPEIEVGGSVWLIIPETNK